MTPSPRLVHASSARRNVRPDVAIVVVTYQRDDMLAHTLAQIARLETLPGKCIIVDQGEIEDKSDLLEPLRMVGVPTKHVFSRYRSISAARNIGLEYAGSEDILLYLDDDVEIVSDIVAIHGSYYDAEPTLAGVAGHIICQNHGEEFVRKNTFRPIGDYVPGGRGCHMSFRAEALRSIGGFNAYICNNGDETELYRRLARAGNRIRNGSHALVKHLVCPTGGNREVGIRSHDHYRRVMRDGMIRCVKDRGPWAGVVWPIKNWRTTARLFQTAPTRWSKWSHAAREIARGYRLAILSHRRTDYIDLSLELASGAGVDRATGLPVV